MLYISKFSPDLKSNTRFSLRLSDSLSPTFIIRQQSLQASQTPFTTKLITNYTSGWREPQYGAGPFCYFNCCYFEEWRFSKFCHGCPGRMDELWIIYHVCGNTLGVRHGGCRAPHISLLVTAGALIGDWWRGISFIARPPLPAPRH